MTLNGDCQRQIDALIKRIDGQYARYQQHAKLSDSSFDILYALFTGQDGCTQKQLCDVCYCSKQTIHSAIRRLAAQDLVRVEPGPGHSTHIFLTESGHAQAQTCIAPLTAAEEQALDLFSPDELQRFVAGMRAYADRLEAGIARLVAEPAPEPSAPGKPAASFPASNGRQE